MKIVQVNGKIKFEATDGTHHDDVKLCSRHDLSELLVDFGVGTGHKWTKDDFLDFLIENQKEVVKRMTAIGPVLVREISPGDND